jgi:hypothetical protein
MSDFLGCFQAWYLKLRHHAWQSLTSSQNRDRNLFLKVLRYTRKGDFLTKNVEKVGVNNDFAVKHLGKNLRKSKGKWRVNSSDTIETEVLIYSRNRDQTTIIIANSRDRGLKAEYMNAVQKAIGIIWELAKLYKFLQLVFPLHIFLFPFFQAIVSKSLNEFFIFILSVTLFILN